MTYHQVHPTAFPGDEAAVVGLPVQDSHAVDTTGDAGLPVHGGHKYGTTGNAGVRAPLQSAEWHDPSATATSYAPGPDWLDPYQTPATEIAYLPPKHDAVVNEFPSVPKIFSRIGTRNTRWSDKSGLSGSADGTSSSSRSAKSRSSRRSSRGRFFFSKTGSWAVEIFSMVVAVLALGAIVGILAFYDGKPLAAWHLDITINAVIAILTAVVTASISVALAGGLGQLKWIQFTQGRPLSDMELFDDASRGTLGALSLLFRGRGGFSSALGAAVVLASLLVGPFAQQIARYPIQTTPSMAGATNPRAANYTGFLHGDNTNAAFVPVLPLKSAVYQGMFAENGNPLITLPFNCETGSCTWEPFDTLAVCYSCVDMSEYMTRYCAGGIPADGNTTACGWSLPSGAKLHSSDDVFSMTSLFSDASNSYSTIMKLVFMGTESQNGTAGELNPWAQQCTLSACVQTIASAVENGALSENVTGQIVNTTVPTSAGAFQLEADGSGSLAPIYITGSAASNGTAFEIATEAVLAMQSWWATLFANGSASRSLTNQTVSQRNVVVNLTVGISSGETFFDSDVVQAFYWNFYEYPGGIEMLVHDLATSVTVSFRSFFGVEKVQGTAWTSETFVHVRWGFVSVPLLVVVMAAAFLVAAMVQTRASGTSLWKSSTLAVLFHGLDDEAKARFADLNGLYAKKREASAVEVKLTDAATGRQRLTINRNYY